VTIRLEAEGPGVRGLARLAPGEFQRLESRPQLDRAIAALRAEPEIELATAKDAAAGAAFAIVQETGSVALLAESSSTTLSELGTTVALRGRFKR